MRICSLFSSPFIDAGITPMKRGLKELEHTGLERLFHKDAGITPMKRGLKAFNKHCISTLQT